MDEGVGVGDVAGKLVLKGALGVVAESFCCVFSWLHFCLAVVYASAVDARWCAGLHSAGDEAVRCKLFCDAFCCPLS